MQINGKPLLSIWLKRLVTAGYGPFLVNSHHLHEKIESYVLNSEYKKYIQISYEKKILGTAGTLINNLEYLAGGGLLAHADNYCLSNFQEFLKAHHNRPKSCLMTMMTFKTLKPDLCGIVKKNSNNVVTKFYEKDQQYNGDTANAAIYLLSREIINEISRNFTNCSDFSTEIIPEFLNKIYTYHTTEPVVDIGTIEDFHLANKIDIDYGHKK
tara:strand:+ start:161 stop:796 length:636 start_codon:yes stop_codon:yes gene_type:complete